MAGMPWFCLIVFCAAFAATIVAVPWIISLAHLLGAIDSPDGFRKNHGGATPRMGGLAVAFGLLCALLALAAVAPSMLGELKGDLAHSGLATVAALLILLVIGIRDDQRGLSPMFKLAGQTLVAGLLYIDGFQIQRIFLFGYNLDFGIWALPATCFWFLGCINVWNLIDGMDGLASGVGAIVAVTLALAAGTLGNDAAACAAMALAGALLGFLIFNFHPARIFLGDTGSLLLGAVLGMIAIKGSLKSGMTIAILVPVLAMGLPIVDTLLAIVRRWLRHLPWNVADNGHLHHRLMKFGLNQRQASLFLYSFTVLLCVSSLASLGMQSDALATLFAVLGTLGLLTVFAIRRDDFAGFFEDFRRRLRHRRLEQRFARIVWETIQRLAHCGTPERLIAAAEAMAQQLCCDGFGLWYRRDGELMATRSWHATPTGAADHPDRQLLQLRFTLADWPGEQLTLEFSQREDQNVPLSVGGRFLCRFNRELLARIRQLLADDCTALGSTRTEVGDQAWKSARQDKQSPLRHSIG